MSIQTGGSWSIFYLKCTHNPTIAELLKKLQNCQAKRVNQISLTVPLHSLHNVKSSVTGWLLLTVGCFGVWTQYVVFQSTMTLSRKGLMVTGATQFPLNLVYCDVQLELSCQDCRCQRKRCESVTAAGLWVRQAVAYQPKAQREWRQKPFKAVRSQGASGHGGLDGESILFCLLAISRFSCVIPPKLSLTLSLIKTIPPAAALHLSPVGVPAPPQLGFKFSSYAFISF